MLDIPEMLMIGGNTRNSGKTTMACDLISKLSVYQEVIGLKVTAIRPGEIELHGNHKSQDLMPEFSIFEELDPLSHKDTSKMLQAGATRVFFICVSEFFLEKALLLFLSKYINNQVIVCESRSLRRLVNPGLFLMMMRLPAEGKTKDHIGDFLSLADKVFYFDENLSDRSQFVANLHFVNGKFTSYCE